MKITKLLPTIADKNSEPIVVPSSRLVRLVKGEERWEASNHPQSVLPRNWDRIEPNHIVTCMVLKASANDRRHLALCHDEFRGPRSGLCRSGTMKGVPEEEEEEEDEGEVWSSRTTPPPKLPCTLIQLAEEEEEDYWASIPEPPDGGWGWVIVMSSFMCNVVVDGIAYSFGIFLVPFVNYYKSSKGKTAWVGSLLAGCYLLAGALIGLYRNRYTLQQLRKDVLQENKVFCTIEDFGQKFTCRNCGGRDRGRVAIYRPFGEA
ncbi:monocarboxylate transporter 12 [Trichonephila clavipes]|nr:monocarboxylate transporter 12 [Trichonephila clavipes]